MYYIDDFERYLEEEKGTSAATRSAYLADIDDFEQFLLPRGKKFETAGSADAAAYLMALESEGKSAATVGRRLSSIRTFYKYLISREAVKRNPCEGLKAPKAKKRELEFLSEEQIVRLIELPDESDAGLRDRALLELMYATGLRVSELCEANIADVDLRIGYVSVVSKDKARMVPMGKPCIKALKKYLKESRPRLLGKKEDCGALFLSYLGERITRQGIWKILKTYAAKTDFADKVSPQVIRNSFAAHLIMNGADLKSLQELMGHEDIMATKIFLSLTKNRIMDVYDRAFPRA